MRSPRDVHRSRIHAALRLQSPKLLERFARGRQSGPQFQRFLEIGNRALLVAEPHPGLTAIVPGEYVSGIVLQRLVVIGEAALVVALVEPDHAAIAPAARIGRRHADRLAIVGGGAVELLAVAIDVAAVDIGKQIGRELVRVV